MVSLKTEPIKRAARLRQEADDVLQKVSLHDVLRPYGRIVPSGSYFLDVMIYPDIDLYISQVSIAQLFKIGGQFAASEWVAQVVFERSRTPKLPGGLYLKLRIAHGDWGRPWKIDIWSLDDALIDENMQDMHRFKQAMTADLREQILNYKFSILTDEHRTPMYSGYFIYKAFIDEGLTDFQDVSRYLADNGIQMSSSTQHE